MVPPIYTTIFGILGNVFSVLTYFAPMPTFYHIFKNKSTGSFHSAPYAFAFLSSLTWICYALLKSHSLLIIGINLFGCVMEGIFLTMFLTYAPRVSKIRTTKLLVLLAALFALVFLPAFFFFKGPLRLSILGWICVLTSITVFAAPFTIMKVVIRTKSVEFMPFALSLFLTLTAMTWFTYGMLLNDYFVALPNVLGFIFSVTQMILYAKYRKPRSTTMEEKLPVTDLDRRSDSKLTSELSQVSGNHVDKEREISKDQNVGEKNGKNLNSADKSRMTKCEV